MATTQKDKIQRGFESTLDKKFEEVRRALKQVGPIISTDIEKMLSDTRAPGSSVQHNIAARRFRKEGAVSGLNQVRLMSGKFMRYGNNEANAVFEAVGVKIKGNPPTVEAVLDAANKLKIGKLNTEQALSAMTTAAYYAQVYDQSKPGIDYLTKFHESVVTRLRGVPALGKDKEPTIKPEYEQVFSQLGHLDGNDRKGNNISQQIARYISGKELPTWLTNADQEEGKETAAIDLKGISPERLTLMGMKEVDFAAKQTYSYIVSHLIEAQLAQPQLANGEKNTFKNIFEVKVGEENREEVLQLLSINGEETIHDVERSLEVKTNYIIETVNQLLSAAPNQYATVFSNEFLTRTGSDPDIMRTLLTQQILDSAVSTGAFAAQTTEEFLYSISLGCAANKDLSAMFNPEISMDPNNPEQPPQYVTLLYGNEGDIHVYAEDVTAAGPSEYEFAGIKEKIAAEEISIYGDSADLSSANKNLLFPNTNRAAHMFYSAHEGVRTKKMLEEMQAIELEEARISTKQNSTGLFRSLQKYKTMVAEAKKLYEKYGIKLSDGYLSGNPSPAPIPQSPNKDNDPVQNDPGQGQDQDPTQTVPVAGVQDPNSQDANQPNGHNPEEQGGTQDPTQTTPVKGESTAEELIARIDDFTRTQGGEGVSIVEREHDGYEGQLGWVDPKQLIGSVAVNPEGQDQGQ